MSGLAQTFRGLGAGHLAILGGTGVGIILFFMFLTSKLTTPNMVLLFGELEMQDSAAIVGKLDTMGIPYELHGDGTRILVPSDQVLRLRMSMAQDGLPAGGTVGYELFDGAESLGTTNFVQNVNLVRALEGELARTIRSINGVRGARVHLVLPQRQMFSRTQEEPSASVVLQVRGSSTLNPVQVQAIQHLVASAIPAMKAGKVTVIDDKGTLLARSNDENTDIALATQSTDLRRSYEDSLGQTIQSLLERTVGPGKVRAKVTALMDFDRITTRTEQYDPDGQVVRSTQTVQEQSDSSEASASDTVTVENNIPDAAAAAASGPQSASRANRTEETVNYEITKKVTDHYKEAGSIRRLSVAVLVDGEYTAAQDGTRTYEPRTEEQLAQMTRLVKSAIGFDEARGDTVEIVNMPFGHLEGDWQEETYEPLFGLGKNDYFRIAEILVLSIVALLVIMLVVRPLVARTLEALPKPADVQKAAQNLLADNSGGGAPALPGASPMGAMAPPGAAGALGADMPESLINLEQVEGRVRASSIKKVGEIVQKHPEESVSILRNWLYQET